MKKTMIVVRQLFILSLLFMTACSTQKELEPKVRLETTMGDILLRLYPETPAHRDNFMKLVDDGFYDGTLFHRVIADFMIQAGDPQSRHARPGQALGTGDVGYTVPAEFAYPQRYHKRGALAAARQGDWTNPQKASSGCQFYIVQGRTFTDAELDAMERNMLRRTETALFQAKMNARSEEVRRYRLERNQEALQALGDSLLAEVRAEMKQDSTLGRFTSAQREDYKTLGGTPHLDGEYTVFGEVIEGMDVVTRISEVETGRMDRPQEDVRIVKARRVK